MRAFCYYCVPVLACVALMPVLTATTIAGPCGIPEDALTGPCEGMNPPIFINTRRTDPDKVRFCIRESPGHVMLCMDEDRSSDDPQGVRLSDCCLLVGPCSGKTWGDIDECADICATQIACPDDD